MIPPPPQQIQADGEAPSAVPLKLTIKRHCYEDKSE